jgi:hypothetical protein
MSPKILSLVSAGVGVLIGAGLVWLTLGERLGEPRSATSESGKSSSPKSAGAPTLSSASVLQIKPNIAGSSLSSGNAGAIKRTQPPESALRLAYKSATDYKSVLAMIDTLPGNPEALRIKAQIMERCVKVSDEISLDSSEEMERWDAVSKIVGEKAKQKSTGRDRRKEFIESLPPQHRDNPARIAAYDRLQLENQAAKSTVDSNPCSSIDSLKMTKSEREALWKAAETAGDPFAQVRSFHCGFSENHAATWREKDPNRIVTMMEERRERRIMSAEKLERYKSLLAQATHETIAPLLYMLLSSYPNGYFTLEGEANLSSQPRINKRLPNIVACEMGLQCEKSRAWELDQACANKGRCDAGNIEDYWRFYVLPPSQAQELESQRAAMMKIIDTRDLSGLRFIPRPNVNVGEDEDEYVIDYSADLSCG